MIDDSGSILTYAMTALQDQSSEVSKLEGVKSETAKLTQYVQGVEEEHLSKISGK